MQQLKLGLVIANPELSREVRETCLKTLDVRPLVEQAGIGDAAAFLDQLEQLRLDVLVVDSSLGFQSRLRISFGGSSPALQLRSSSP